VTGGSETLEEVSAVADPVCPYLGMVGDRHGHHTFPSRLHLCHAGEPAHIGLGFQADYCLGGGYPSCARFQRAEEAAAAERAAVGAVAVPAVADGTVATAALGPVAATSAKLGQVRSPDDRRSSPLVSILLGLALVSTLAALAIAAGVIKLPAGGPVAGVPTPTPTGLVSPTVAPTDTFAPSATASATPTTAPTATSTPASGEITHVVQPGETLTSIAELYEVSIDAIAARNGITDLNSIQVGQTLIIPVSGASPSPSEPPNSSPTVSPVATSFIYVVQSGDTLFKIADKFDVTQQEILDANPDITDANTIFVGQEIVIPAAP
jgi:LysM repeat protein